MDESPQVIVDSKNSDCRSGPLIIQHLAPCKPFYFFPKHRPVRPLVTVTGRESAVPIAQIAEETMKKGIHPRRQWISYVTQSGRLINIMMTKIHKVGKVYHLRAKTQMADDIGQIAKYKRRYELQDNEDETEQK